MKLSEVIPLIDYFVIGSRNISILNKELIPRIEKHLSFNSISTYGNGNNNPMYYVEIPAKLIKHAADILTGIPELEIAVNKSVNCRIYNHMGYDGYIVRWVPLDTSNSPVLTRTIQL